MTWQILKPMMLAVALTASGGCSMFRGDDAVSGDHEVISGVSADPVIEPELDRRDVQRAAIDNEDWEFAGYGGFLSVEDFGTEPIGDVYDNIIVRLLEVAQSIEIIEMRQVGDAV